MGQTPSEGRGGSDLLGATIPYLIFRQSGGPSIREGRLGLGSDSYPVTKKTVEAANQSLRLLLAQTVCSLYVLILFVGATRIVR